MNLEIIYNFAKETLEDDTTGHDWKHALRVEKNALAISPPSLAKKEIEVIKAACWLHDTIDPKLSKSNKQTIAHLKTVLKNADATPDQITEIIYMIQNLSYSKNIEQKQPLSFLGEIVQDADRLDAIGAIGIARAFYYGGSQKHALYNHSTPRTKDGLTEENYRDQGTIINHFFEKLLLLKDSMNTEKAKEMAIERTKIMENFLVDFFNEVGLH